MVADLLVLNECDKVGHGIQVLGNELFILDDDIEGLLEEGDQLQDPCGVQNTVVQERVFIPEVIMHHIVDEMIEEVAADSLTHAHYCVLSMHRLVVQHLVAVHFRTPLLEASAACGGAFLLYERVSLRFSSAYFADLE